MRLSSEVVAGLRAMFECRLYFQETGAPDIDLALVVLCPEGADPAEFRARLAPELERMKSRSGVGAVSFRSGDDCYQLRILTDGQAIAVSCAVTTPGGNTSARDSLDGLSAREQQVLELLVEGLSNKQVAARLFLSPRTVEKHRASIYRKTGSNSLAVLTKVWLDSGRVQSRREVS